MTRSYPTCTEAETAGYIERDRLAGSAHAGTLSHMPRYFHVSVLEQPEFTERRVAQRRKLQASVTMHSGCRRRWIDHGNGYSPAYDRRKP